jgi:hypothetical protein
MTISAPKEVWCADITYVPMRPGYLYLVALMDWFSRYVLAWELSNSLEVAFFPGGAGGCAGGRSAGDFQERLGEAIYERGLYRKTHPRGDPDQHGRAGPGGGQHLYRAVVPKRKVRGNLCARLRGRQSGTAWTLSILSASTTPSGLPKVWATAHRPTCISGGTEAGMRSPPPPPGEAKQKERQKQQQK